MNKGKVSRVVSFALAFLVILNLNVAPDFDHGLFNSGFLQFGSKAYAASNQWIYFTDNTNDNIYKIRSDGTGLARVNYDLSQNVAVDANEQWLYYNSSGRIYKIRTDGTDKTLLYSNNMSNPIVSADGQYLYYSNTSNYGYIYKAKTDGSSQGSIGGGWLNNFTLSRDNQWIYYGRSSGGLCKVRTDGTEFTQLSYANAYNVNATPDGQWLYYANQSDHYYLYKIKTDGTGETRLNTHASYGLKLSENGKYLYYSDNSQLYKYDISNQTDTATGFSGSPVSVSSDGKMIFYGNPLSSYHLYKFDYGSGDRSILANIVPNNIVVASNKIPSITVISPTPNQMLTENDTSFIPTASVSDTDNDTLTCKYYVDSESSPRDTKTLSNVSWPQTVTFSALNMNTLTEGNHTVKFEVSDGILDPVQSTVNIIVDKSAPTLGTVTATSTNSSITISGTATDSISGLDTLPYRYTIGTNPPTSWMAGSSYTQDSLTPNTQYTVKFEARDTKGHIAENTQNIYTKAEAPALSVNNPTSYTLTVATADNNPTSTQYQITTDNGTKYVTPEGTLTSVPLWITLSAKKITISGLSPNTPYTFTAKAKNVEVIETSAIQATGTTLVEPPTPPTNLTATATGNSITVNWDAAAGATGYEIEAGGTVVDTGIGTTYTHIGLTPDTQYTYRVRARNAGGAGAWSSPITKSTQALSPWTPLNVNAAATTTSVIVTWGAVGGAGGYDVEVDGTVVNNGSSTNYIHNGLTPGTQHSYKVRSINFGGKSDWSNEILIYTLAEKPPVPANLGGTVGRDQIILSWDAVAGATYDLKIDGFEVENITGTTYTHSSLLPGTQHTYQVRAKKNGGESDWSTTLTLSTLPDTFGTPSGFKAEAADTSVLLSWNAVAGVTGYDVEVDGAVLDNETDTTAAFAGLTPNTQHTYRVRAKSATEISEWSTPISLITFLLPTPTNITSQSTDTTITVNWDAVNDAESYDLEIDGTVIDNLIAATYTCTGLAPNTQHVFKVKAKNSNGASTWSVPLTKSTEFNAFNIPANVAAMVKNNHTIIVWSAVANATAYDIEADGVVTENITGTSYLHNGLTSETLHTYRVRAKKGAVTGGWSNLLTVFTLPEGPQTPANVTASATTTSIMVTWDETDNVNGYEIEVDGTVVDNGTGTSYLHSGLSPDTQHTYRVRSRNASGTSVWSPAVTLNTRSSTETYTVDCTNNEVFNLVFMASDIQDPSAYTFTVTYDTQELEVLDLCGTTPRVDLTTGNLVGTDVQVVQFTPGTIVFIKVTTVQPGQSWSGVVDSIKFKSKVNGQAAVIYCIE